MQNPHLQAAPDVMKTTVETSWGNLIPTKPPPEGGHPPHPFVDCQDWG
ncbi:hypothetical protein SLEP1_g5080 [Rubroshorea leprosula]|uniref:Uncharacterized protein n=1 Tax=Rubroshorea leprosula TaxID=152421 RepID=A0AAV5HWN8_9ROSI|nr:hypothetical protein SLEP1_g5080 [Rubroshorea leprosula]